MPERGLRELAYPRGKTLDIPGHDKVPDRILALQRAIEYEIDRQIEIVEEGGEVDQETRLWDDNQKVTKTMRSKEDANDYRYFPEPDLMPVEISREWVEEIRKKMPELPEAKRKRYESLGLSAYDANVMVEQMETALFYDKVLELGADYRIANNLLVGDITAFLKEHNININQTKLTPQHLAELVNLISKGTISNNIAKKILPQMLENGTNPQEIIEKEGLSVISDEGAIKELVEKVIAANPAQVQAYKNGKTNLMGFFVGQIMKETKGRANPQIINKLLGEALNK